MRFATQLTSVFLSLKNAEEKSTTEDLLSVARRCIEVGLVSAACQVGRVILSHFVVGSAPAVPDTA